MGVDDDLVHETHNGTIVFMNGSMLFFARLLAAEVAEDVLNRIEGVRLPGNALQIVQNVSTESYKEAERAALHEELDVLNPVQILGIVDEDIDRRPLAS